VGKGSDTHCNPPALRPLPLLRHPRPWRSIAHLLVPPAGSYLREVDVEVVGTWWSERAGCVAHSQVGQFALRQRVLRCRQIWNEFFHLSHKIGVQLICGVTFPVHTADPSMSTMSTCPPTVEITPYNNPLRLPSILISAMNVLIVVRHPQ